MVWLLVCSRGVFVQGCDECGGLVAVQPGCTMVLQRSFPVWVEYITGVLSLFFVAGGVVV